MAKLRRSAGRQAVVKKARAKAPAKPSKVRPAVRKAHSKPKAVAKPKPVTTPKARPAAKPAARGRQKPIAAAPPPRRSTYADAVVLYERGLHALQAKRYREAADALRRVIVEFPEEIELHERARLYVRVCERQFAPLDATPKTPEEQVYAATLAMNAGALDRAVALLTAALQQKKDNDAAEYMLGVVLAAKGDQPGAIVHLVRAIELNPDTRELLRKEPEFEGLRQTNELQAALAASAAASRRDRRNLPRVRR
jgi:tetratricopeptide (TPR) repeat protein